MNSTLFTNIGRLVQVGREDTLRLRGRDMQHLPTLDHAWLLVENGRIKDYGTDQPPRADEQVDLHGQWVFPSWVDSHTHLVFAASREDEWVDRLRGLSYFEIAAKGGGILNSAQRLRDTSEEQLLLGATQRLAEVQRLGTGALEVKSGYGLTLEAELKMLRVIRQLREQSGVDIRATFLGAHALPLEYRDRRDDYVRLVTEEMLPRIAEEQLADYIDVFCEKGFFTVNETITIIEAGARYGLKAKVHLNQFNSLGAVRACVERQALSVDHLEVFSPRDISALADSETIATVLPTAPFFLNDPYPDIRKLLTANAIVALASDYNPGSTPSGRMSFVLSLACIKCGMLPAEAINAATLNGAAALEWSDRYGSIDRGKWATFYTTDALPSVDYLPYAFGSDLVRRVFNRGKEVRIDGTLTHTLRG